MAKAVLNNHGIATRAGDMTVYNFDGDTREYRSSSVEYLAVGVGIPANSCSDAPGNMKAGFAVCRTVGADTWEYVPDHRGETVYDKISGLPVEITVPGDYPDNVTAIAPSTPYDTWNGNQWVIDEDALKRGQVQDAEQKKTALLAAAKSAISLWQTELQLGLISDADKARLIAWMKYIQTLQSIDTSTAPDITWPDEPE
ncbi:tail fiber assembly protein [Lonsdalea quercina]|uniref:tail fiber assembly protein n=1 Tax=Lonsdalea quercina TaxID=71657 RepID=UPI003976BA6E